MDESGNDIFPEENEPQPEQSNRTFIIAAGIMAGVVLITIICMAVYALVYLPQQKAGQSSQQATIEAQNALIAQAMTQTMQSAALATQQAPVQATATMQPLSLASATPLLAVASPTATSQQLNLTATWAVLNTQVAVGLKTPTPTLAAGMPDSGFADEVGLPGLVVMAMALVVVILLARRMRAAPVR